MSHAGRQALDVQGIRVESGPGRSFSIDPVRTILDIDLLARSVGLCRIRSVLLVAIGLAGVGLGGQLPLCGRRLASFRSVLVTRGFGRSDLLASSLGGLLTVGFGPRVLAFLELGLFESVRCLSLGSSRLLRSGRLRARSDRSILGLFCRCCRRSFGGTGRSGFALSRRRNIRRRWIDSRSSVVRRRLGRNRRRASLSGRLSRLYRVDLSRLLLLLLLRWRLLLLLLLLSLQRSILTSRARSSNSRRLGPIRDRGSRSRVGLRMSSRLDRSTRLLEPSVAKVETCTKLRVRSGPNLTSSIIRLP